MDRKPGISKRGNIDINAKVFHVVQRTTMKLPLFESDSVFSYWQSHLKACAIEHNVVLLCYVLMANHYHVLLYSENTENILTMFRKLNTGFCQFIKSKVIKGTETEKIFTDEFPYRLFSSAVRLFPVEGMVPLLIDTKYLFDNPKHHNSRNQGLYYPHSNFLTLYKGEFARKDLSLFFNLYGMYPGSLMKLIVKPLPDFREIVNGIGMNADRLKQDSVFFHDPSAERSESAEKIRGKYMVFDIN